MIDIVNIVVLSLLFLALIVRAILKIYERRLKRKLDALKWKKVESMKSGFYSVNREHGGNISIYRDGKKAAMIVTGKTLTPEEQQLLYDIVTEHFMTLNTEN